MTEIKQNYLNSLANSNNPEDKKKLELANQIFAQTRSSIITNLEVESTLQGATSAIGKKSDEDGVKAYQNENLDVLKAYESAVISLLKNPDFENKFLDIEASNLPQEEKNKKYKELVDSTAQAANGYISTAIQSGYDNIQTIKSKILNDEGLMIGKEYAEKRLEWIGGADIINKRYEGLTESLKNEPILAQQQKYTVLKLEAEAEKEIKVQNAARDNLIITDNNKIAGELDKSLKEIRTKGEIDKQLKILETKTQRITTELQGQYGVIQKRVEGDEQRRTTEFTSEVHHRWDSRTRVVDNANSKIQEGKDSSFALERAHLQVILNDHVESLIQSKDSEMNEKIHRLHKLIDKGVDASGKPLEEPAGISAEVKMARREYLKQLVAKQVVEEYAAKSNIIDLKTVTGFAEAAYGVPKFFLKPTEEEMLKDKLVNPDDKNVFGSDIYIGKKIQKEIKSHKFSGQDENGNKLYSVTLSDGSIQKDIPESRIMAQLAVDSAGTKKGSNYVYVAKNVVSQVKTKGRGDRVRGYSDSLYAAIDENESLTEEQKAKNKALTLNAIESISEGGIGGIIQGMIKLFLSGQLKLAFKLFKDELIPNFKSFFGGSKDNNSQSNQTQNQQQNSVTPKPELSFEAATLNNALKDNKLEIPEKESLQNLFKSEEKVMEALKELRKVAEKAGKTVDVIQLNDLARTISASLGITGGEPVATGTKSPTELPTEIKEDAAKKTIQNIILN
jgi:hypothetical protein